AGDRRWRVPAEPPGRAGDRSRFEEALDDVAAPAAAGVAGGGVDQRGGEPGDVVERGEQAGVAADATAEVGVLVVDPAADQAAVVDLGGDRERQRRDAREPRAGQ